MTALSDILNGLGTNLQSPVTQIGLALMRRGDPYGTAGQLGAAGLDASQAIAFQQHQQALQAYRQATLQQQQAQAQRQAQQDAQQAQQRQLLADPKFQAQLSPNARMAAQAGADLNTVLDTQRADALASYRSQMLQLQTRAQDRLDARANAGAGGSGTHMGAMRQFVDQPLPNGQYQRLQLNPQTGQYEAFGAPFNPHSPRSGKSSPSTSGAGAKAQSLVDQILGSQADNSASVPPTAPLANAGMGDLSSYAPLQGAPLLTSNGSMPAKANSVPAHLDPDLLAAKDAIARGANPAAVRQRLMQAGYSEAALKSAGF